MNHEDIQKMANRVGLFELDSEMLDRLLVLTGEANANVARLPKQLKADEPAHVFFVPQRGSI